MKKKLILVMLCLSTLYACSNDTTDINAIKEDNANSIIIKERIAENKKVAISVKEILDEFVYSEEFVEVSSELNQYQEDNKLIYFINQKNSMINAMLHNVYDSYVDTELAEEETESYLEYTKKYIKSGIYENIKDGTVYIVYSVSDGIDNYNLKVKVLGGKINEIQDK